MILDHLENIDSYRHLDPDIYAGLAYLKGLTPNVQLGEYEVTERVRCLVTSYDTSTDKPDRFEAHRENIDIQFPIVGTERIEWSNRGKMQPVTEYDPKKDRLYYASPENRTTMVIGDGYFSIFFPGDPHRPQLAAGDNGETIKKVTLKVRVRT